MYFYYLQTLFYLCCIIICNIHSLIFFSTGYHEIRGEIIGPGPAAYTKIDYDAIKRRSPAYSLKGRHILLERLRSPAPVFYPLYDTRKRAPMYSFGIKHSECTGIPMTQLDN